MESFELKMAVILMKNFSIAASFAKRQHFSLYLVFYFILEQFVLKCLDKKFNCDEYFIME